MRDGFHFWAFLLAPLWMLWHRLWLVFVGFVVVTVALQLALYALGVGGGGRLLAYALLALLVGLEAGTLRRWTLHAARLARSRHRFRRQTRGGRAAILRRLDGDGRRGRRAATGIVPRAGALGAGGAAVEPVARHRRAVPGAGGAAVTVAIVDYGSGNLHSAAKAFERAARESGHAQPIVVTREPDEVARADRVVLPGVGAFADCRHGLDAIPGMVEALDETVRRKGRPFLGICVGMQLMAERGLEYEVAQGFGWIRGEVDRIAPADARLKIPHMGWNTLDPARPHALSPASRPGRRGCTPISCTPTTSSRRSAAMSSPRPTMAAR